MPTKFNINGTNKKTQNLTVVVRIRPLLDNEKQNEVVTTRLDDKMVLLSDPVAGNPSDVLRAKRALDKQYVFDCAFDGYSSQKDLYEKTTKALVENVMEGYNGTVFAYGATGSGKTYTMVGSNDDPGIMVRALKDLFTEVDKEQAAFEVAMSYLEIYNEAIRDLLSPSGHLELREDANGNHQVIGLSEAKIASSQQVMSLLTRGNRQRMQEATGANATSSRSHALLVVRVQKTTNSTKQGTQQIRTGSLYMVDLAGSERAANTQNTGKRLVEGAHINKSLLALGNCINALAERHVRYVNFRDSKLTRLLKEPLTGNCRTVMVAHVSPHVRHYEETRNTLVYADRAKNITTKLKSNISDVSFHVAQYQSIINELRQEIQCLQDKIQDRGSENESSSSTPSNHKNIEKRLSENEMKDLKEKLIESFNTQMEVRRRMMEIDNTLLGQSVEFDKLNMILNEWETEKAVTAIDNGDIDAANNETLPENIRQAWDDLQYLKAQQQRYLQMREDCQLDYEECKEKTHKATESLPDKRASTQEQRELLHLLARVYELEVEKLELQASQFVRDHELRYRDLMLRRYDRQRQLCDDIITRQRQLIDAMSADGKDKNGDARKELNELYRIYQQEIQELNAGRESCQNTTSGTRVGSANGLRPLGTSGSMMELHQLKQNSNGENPLPPIQNNSLENENEEWLFQRRKSHPATQYNTQGAERTDSGDWSVKSHSSTESPKVLPPLDKNPAEMPPKYVNEVANAKTRGFERNNNNKNLGVNSSPSISWTSSNNDQRPLFMKQPKTSPLTNHKVGEAWRQEIVPMNGSLSEDSDERLYRSGAGAPSRRYGLLPSLRRRVGETARKGTVNSDTEITRHRIRQRPIRLPYRSPEIDIRNQRDKTQIENRQKRSYDRNTDQYYSRR